jgi:hypothetical protein
MSCSVTSAVRVEIRPLLGVDFLERTLVSTDPALITLVERCEGKRRDEP